MNFEKNILTPDEIVKIEKDRVDSDVELIKNGAELVFDESGHIRLDTTEEQKQKAENEMAIELGYAKSINLEDIIERSRGVSASAMILTKLAFKGPEIYCRVVPNLGTGVEIWQKYKNECNQDLDVLIKKYGINKIVEDIAEKINMADICERAGSTHASVMVLTKLALRGADIYSRVVPNLGTGVEIWLKFKNECNQDLDVLIEKFGK